MAALASMMGRFFGSGYDITNGYLGSSFLAPGRGVASGAVFDLSGPKSS